MEEVSNIMAVFPQSDFSNLTNITDLLPVVDTFTEGSIGVGIWIMISLGLNLFSADNLLGT